jgi:hypothetical protein
MVLTDASTWRVILPLQRIFTEVGKLWPGIIPSNVNDDLANLRTSWEERMIDWCLTRSTRKEAMIIILSCLNIPGLIWRLRFILEIVFPGPTYLRHYFGPAPGNIWPLLYFRRFYQFFLLDK